MGWNFEDNANWYASTWGDQLRWFVMTGPSLKDLRSDFMELTGRPPVPPRPTFGLWISEFGYDNWDEIREDLDSLMANQFPVDGVALDLQWFGGNFDSNERDAVCQPDRMGTLQFNLKNFPAPETEIKKFFDNYGVRFMTIEEPLIDNRIPEHANLWNQKFLARVSDMEPVTVTRDFRKNGAASNCVWWGQGGLMDWSNPNARQFWHQQKRLNLSLMGITSHWLDLGEPEMYYQDGIYHGFPDLGKTRHGDIHNVYNLFWAKGVFEGYRNPTNQSQLKQALGLHEAPRHFTLSRAGTVGSQRYTGMWSGDVAPNMENLRGHLQTQMHMSLAGMDYYSSDAGGFLPAQDGGIQPSQVDELYTQWFANNALLDIPLRPHAWAFGEENGNIHIAPDHRGHKPSNRANLLLRYELAPYLYSLAHRAHRFGEPVFPPLVYHFQDDPNVPGIGNVKLIGDALLLGIVATFGQTDRRVYLPRGRWVDYHSGRWYDSVGGEISGVALYRERLHQPSIFTVPLFARAGAIIPQMYVDEKTRTISGRRDIDRATLSDEGRQRENILTNELRLKIFASTDESSFTLYEDDGMTLDYLNGKVRETEISQHAEVDKIVVTVHEARGTFHGANALRTNRIEMVVDKRQATGVEVSGQALPHLNSCTDDIESGKVGWCNAGPNLILIRGGMDSVDHAKQFVIRLAT
jgi:alpha-glucosidase